MHLYAFTENKDKTFKYICICIVAYKLDSETKRKTVIRLPNNIVLFTKTRFWNNFSYFGNHRRNNFFY